MTEQLSEFELIRRFFVESMPKPLHSVLALGIGDDAAVINIAADSQLVSTIDTSIAGVHFPVNANPYDIAYRALSVNVSDLAAMGARPSFYTLALSLKQADPVWLQAFAQGLADASAQYGIELAGGDTTRGDLSISIAAQGEIETSSFLTRTGARPGDLVYVTGCLGDAYAGLQLALGHDDAINCADQRDRDYLLRRYLRPQARLECGRALRLVASACLDISDGLLGDLGHICLGSKVAAAINSSALPLSSALLAALSYDEAVEAALVGGDDYELCFTIAPNNLEALAKLSQTGVDFSCIGEILAEDDFAVRDRVSCYDEAGQLIRLSGQSYKHF